MYYLVGFDENVTRLALIYPLSKTSHQCLNARYLADILADSYVQGSADGEHWHAHHGGGHDFAAGRRTRVSIRAHNKQEVGRPDGLKMTVLHKLYRSKLVTSYEQEFADVINHGWV